jgi:hypothetical protein
MHELSIEYNFLICSDLSVMLHITSRGSLPITGDKRKNRQQKDHIGQNQSGGIVNMGHLFIIFMQSRKEISCYQLCKGIRVLQYLRQRADL